MWCAPKRSTRATRRSLRAPIRRSTIRRRRRPRARPPRRPSHRRPPRQSRGNRSAPSSADVVVDSIQTAQVVHRPHAMGAQPKLLWRPDALPADLRGQQGADPQPEPHLSRPGLRRAEVRGEALSGASRPCRRSHPTECAVPAASRGGTLSACSPKRQERKSPDAARRPRRTLAELKLQTFDDALGRRIIETHIWAVREGLRGAAAYDLFDGYCQRLVIDGAPLWRAHVAMETLHPQWNGYGYTWRRDLNAIEPEQYAHGSVEGATCSRALSMTSSSGPATARTTPRCAGAWRQDPNSAISRFWKSSSPRARPTTSPISSRSARTATARRERASSIRSRPTARAASATTIRRSCRRRCPALSLAMKAHAGYVIASGLLATYLGEDAGRRVHAGAIMRGSVDKLRAVHLVCRHPRLHPDQRRRAGPRRRRPAQRRVRDFDRLASRRAAARCSNSSATACSPPSPSKRRTRAETCRRALDAAIEAMREHRRAEHGARGGRRSRSPRSISPSISARCFTAMSARPTGSTSPSSARPSTRSRASRRYASRWAARFSSRPSSSPRSMDGDSRLESLGRHALRGVREPKEIFALDLGARQPSPAFCGELTCPRGAYASGIPARRMSSMIRSRWSR